MKIDEFKVRKYHHERFVNLIRITAKGGCPEFKEGISFYESEGCYLNRF